MQNHTVSLSRQVFSTFHLACLALLQGTGVLCHFLHIFSVLQHAMCAQAGLHVDVIAFAGSKPIHAVAHNQRVTLHAIPEP